MVVLLTTTTTTATATTTTGTITATFPGDRVCCSFVYGCAGLFAEGIMEVKEWFRGAFYYPAALSDMDKKAQHVVEDVSAFRARMRHHRSKLCDGKKQRSTDTSIRIMYYAVRV